MTTDKARTEAEAIMWRHAHAANHAAVRKLAEDKAADLNLAYREGFKAGRVEK